MENNEILTEETEVELKPFLDGYAGRKTVRADDTFVVDKDGLPYHVTAADPLYAELAEDYAANPGTWAPEVLPETVYSIAGSIERIEALIQLRLDDFARTLTYGSMLSACTYATSTNPQYAVEGQYCVEIRDATWDAAYAILNSMTAAISGSGKDSYSEGELAALWAQIESQLPVPAWPEGSRGGHGN